MLSTREQEQLARLERWFVRTDPALARSLGSGDPCRRVNRPSVRAALAATGLGVLAAGIALGQFLLIFLACNLLIAALTLHVARPDQRGNAGRVPPVLR